LYRRAGRPRPKGRLLSLLYSRGSAIVRKKKRKKGRKRQRIIA
jgi:hypothetical protein